MKIVPGLAIVFYFAIIIVPLVVVIRETIKDLTRQTESPKKKNSSDHH